MPADRPAHPNQHAVRTPPTTQADSEQPVRIHELTRFLVQAAVGLITLSAVAVERQGFSFARSGLPLR
jgi:hypothetical protein